MYSFSPSQLVPVQVLDEQGGFRYYQACWHPPGAAAARVFVKELLYTDDPHLHARQFHEACVMERLGEAGGHAGVVRHLAHAGCYLLFAWLPGESLRARLERGPLSVAQAWRLLRDLLGTLDHLHGCGVVHHDLKPENVMLPPGWPQGEAGAVLVDFGLAHDSAQPSDLYAGMGVGTPQFMPPEQFRGVRGDPRSDLYALGALLFESLAGQPPFPNALGWLSGCDTQRLPLPGPPALAHLLDLTLQRDPAQRPASAAQLLALLDMEDAGTSDADTAGEA